MERIQNIERKLQEQHLDGLFMTRDTNIRYMTGFTGSESFAVISPNGRAFITDSRYTEWAEKECVDFEIVKYRSPYPNLPETLKILAERYGIKRLGFEKGYVTVDMYEDLRNSMEGIEFVGTSGLVESLRRIKDEQEIQWIKTAAHFADEAFTEILNYVKIGVTEKDIERELQYITKQQRADDIAFPSIVASGKNSSMPHAIPSDRLIEDGDFITFDMGAMYKGYRSDMTRTIIVGHASERQKQVYDIVQSALDRATKTIKSGVAGKILHISATDVIEKSGSAGVFGHGIGHGIGLDIHEDPIMNAACEYILETGNVITVEPGIYIPDWGGVRIEDSVVVTDEGCEIITLSSKKLIVL